MSNIKDDVAIAINDEHCSLAGSILEDYTCTLNITDVEHNNNKFYIMQIIETKPSFAVYIRYGRIGEVGKRIVDEYDNKASAIEFFVKQYKSKTGNKFGEPFVKKEGKYSLVKTEKQQEMKTEKDNENLDDKIEPRVKYFLSLISNEKMLAETLVKMNIDVKKMPLGKISKEQLNSAEDVLKKLKIIFATDSTNEQKIKELSSEFYTLVPQAFGRKKPPVLEEPDIDKYMDFVDELRNIQVTYNMIKNSNNLNKLTNVYDQMNASIAPLEKSSQMYTELTKYVANTQASTHSCKLQVIDIYTVNKGTDHIYDKFTKNMKNKMLLFHGSPIPNWCSIIKSGLLLDPSKLGVKITGKMFGYGIYWANSISKSFNYCGANNTDNIAVLAIAEVALGEILEQYTSNYSLSQAHMDSLKKNSTHGKGGSSPGDFVEIDGVKIPNGKLVKHKTDSFSLLYDEFIIYNSNQYKIKYMIVVKNVV